MNENPIYDEIKLLKAKAISEKEQGDLLFKNKYLEGAVNRYYYSAYNLAQALLISFGDRPKTQSGVIQRFGLLAVDKKIFNKKYAKSLADLYRTREAGDYTAISFIEKTDVEELKSSLEDFIKEINSKLEEFLRNLKSI